jgi:hypothetical protein
VNGHRAQDVLVVVICYVLRANQGACGEWEGARGSKSGQTRATHSLIEHHVIIDALIILEPASEMICAFEDGFCTHTCVHKETGQCSSTAAWHLPVGFGVEAHGVATFVKERVHSAFDESFSALTGRVCKIGSGSGAKCAGWSALITRQLRRGRSMPREEATENSTVAAWTDFFDGGARQFEAAASRLA